MFDILASSTGVVVVVLVIAGGLLWGAITSFTATLCMSLLVGLGFWHTRRATEEAQVLAPDAVAVS